MFEGKKKIDLELSDDQGAGEWNLEKLIDELRRKQLKEKIGRAHV